MATKLCSKPLLLRTCTREEGSGTLPCYKHTFDTLRDQHSDSPQEATALSGATNHMKLEGNIHVGRLSLDVYVW